MMKRKRRLTPALLTAAALAMAGCGSSAGAVSSDNGPASGSSSADAGTHKLTVVASTSAWGNIAEKVGGDRVTVRSLISDPSQDPHSFQPSTKDQLHLSRADVVIVNGGGYDDFVTKMIDSTNNESATVLNADTISGKTAPAGGELNEHVWYDLPTARKVANKIVAAYAKIRPGASATFTKNADSFTAKVDKLQSEEKSIRQKGGGKPVAITEPVPLYMVQAAGLRNKTPDDFSEAIEEGHGASPRVLKETLDLFSGHDVAALIYNSQTAGRQTEKIKSAATKNSIPVVPVTETLPPNKSYIAWMHRNLKAIGKVVAS